MKTGFGSFTDKISVRYLGILALGDVLLMLDSLYGSRRGAALKPRDLAQFERQSSLGDLSANWSLILVREDVLCELRQN